MKHIKRVEDMPADTAYVALAFRKSTVHHEGDERSRTNPGHGYPAYDETIETCEVYAGPSNDADFHQTIEMLYARSPHVVVLQVKGVQRVRSRVVIDMEGQGG